MFNRRYSPSAGIVREERKILPFSITDIGGRAELLAWKEVQKHQQEQWELKQAAKVALVIQGLEDGTIAQTESAKAKTSEITALYKRKAAMDQESARLVNFIKHKEKTLVERYPWYARIYHKSLNFFLNIKF